METHCYWCSTRRYISPISVHNLSRLRTSQVDRYNERKWFYSKKKVLLQKRQEVDNTPYKTITDADYAEDSSLLANTRTQDESPLQILEQAAGGIRLHVNADKKSTCVLIKKGDIWWLFETSVQVHLPQKQRLIYLK